MIAAAVARYAGPGAEVPRRARWNSQEIARPHTRVLKTGVGKPCRRNVGDADLIEEGGVVGPLGVDTDEADGMAAGRDVERRGRVGCVEGAGGGEGVHYRAIYLHGDLLVAGVEVGPLGGADADDVGAGRREIHRLADRGLVPLEEADLAALRGVLVAAVKPLPLPDTPAPVLKLHAAPVGTYW